MAAVIALVSNALWGLPSYLSVTTTRQSDDMPASALIVITALLIGGVSFVAGFVGPLIYTPEANLGPLLGIFVTGPAGFLLGALIGIVWSARRAEDGDLHVQIRWLCVIFALALLFYLFGTTVSGSIVVVAVVLQATVLITGCALLVIGKTGPTTAHASRRRLRFFVVAAAVMLVMAVFPPVKGVDAGPIFPPVKAVDADPIDTPWFAFFMDSGFDESRHIPLYQEDRGQLMLQWFFVAILAFYFARRSYDKRQET